MDFFPRNAHRGRAARCKHPRTVSKLEVRLCNCFRFSLVGIRFPCIRARGLRRLHTSHAKGGDRLQTEAAVHDRLTARTETAFAWMLPSSQIPIRPMRAHTALLIAIAFPGVTSGSRANAQQRLAWPCSILRAAPIPRPVVNLSRHTSSRGAARLS